MFWTKHTSSLKHLLDRMFYLLKWDMNDVDYELGKINTLIEMANSFPFSQIKSHSTSSAILSWKKHPTISTINIFALFVLTRNTIAIFRNWWHALDWNVNYWTLFIELLQIAHKASGKQSFSKSIQSRQNICECSYFEISCRGPKHDKKKPSINVV